MKPVWGISGLLLVAAWLGCAQAQNATARDYSYATADGGYPGGGGGYDYYQSSHYPPEKWGSGPLIPSGCVAPMFNTLGSLGGKALIAALIGIALVKIPLLLLAKTALLKMTLPFGIMAAILPLAVPLISLYMLYNKDNKNSTSSGNRQRSFDSSDDFSSPLQTFLDTPECIETVACKIGTTQAKSQYSQPILWILKRVSTLFDGDAGALLETYRSSYRRGLSGAPCPSNCPTRLVLHQGAAQYNIL